MASRLGRIVLALLLIAIATLAFLLSHNSAPAPAPALSAQAVRMKAIIYRQYGSPDVLRLEDTEKPTPADSELLIKVHAASVNPLDWHYMRGTPYIVRMQTGLGRPRYNRLGVDFSGTVEAIGKSVGHFKIGDEIFGTADGALAEYVTSTEKGLALKPVNVTFEQAAAVPIAGLTALQGLRDKGHLKPGQKVLINGASGGVGTFAVQIARSMGAEVTGVCSTRNVEMVRSLGAAHVIDYTQADFTASAERYDLILDAVGNRALLDVRRVMTPHGTLVIIGGPSSDPWLGPLNNFIKASLLSPFVSQQFVSFIADANKTEDLVFLADLIRAGKVVPAIDRQYRLEDAPEAIRYLEQGHARGKVVIDIE